MNIAYVILSKENEKDVKKITLKSLGKTNEKGIFVIKDEKELTKLNFEGFSHAVILLNGSELTANYKEVIDVYYQDKAVMLPLVILDSEKTNGVLNTCLWNSNITSNVGILDYELSIKQIDLTWLGALIPVEYLVDENFSKEIKYYQHLFFFNKIAEKEIDIIGVPKTLAVIKEDLSFSEISTEEKIKYFKMAKDEKEIIKTIIDVNPSQKLKRV